MLRYDVNDLRLFLMATCALAAISLNIFFPAKA